MHSIFNRKTNHTGLVSRFTITSIRFVGMLWLLLSLSSCGTIMVHNNQSFGGNPCELTSYIYGGVVGDAFLVASAVKSGEVDETVIFLIYGLVDIPLSAVADTIILPIAIYRTISECG